MDYDDSPLYFFGKFSDVCNFKLFSVYLFNLASTFIFTLVPANKNVSSWSLLVDQYEEIGLSSWTVKETVWLEHHKRQVKDLAYKEQFRGLKFQCLRSSIMFGEFTHLCKVLQSKYAWKASKIKFFTWLCVISYVATYLWWINEIWNRFQIVLECK